MSAERTPAILASGRPPAQGSSTPASASAYWADQKLIRTAELRVKVRDVPAALLTADSIAQAQHALVTGSRTIQDDDGKRTGEVVLRIPSQDFAGLLRALHGIGSVQAESVGVQDVTREYTDLETRLTVKEQTVARLRALLDNRTARLADVLQVERELGRAVTELEQMKGERRYYDQQIALSTIRLTLFERVPSQWAQITRPIGSAVENATQILGNSVGALVYLVVGLLPWVVVAVGVVWAVPRLRRRYLTRNTGSLPVTPKS